MSLSQLSRSYTLLVGSLDNVSGTVYSLPETQQTLRFLYQDTYINARASRLLSLSVALEVNAVWFTIPIVLAQLVIIVTSQLDAQTIYLEFRQLVSLFRGRQRLRKEQYRFYQRPRGGRSYRQVSLQVTDYYPELSSLRGVQEDIQSPAFVIVDQYCRFSKSLLDGLERCY